MNSFRFLERGIEAEIARQERILRRRRRGGAGDAPLRPAVGQPHARCARRRRRTTTATSRSRTSCRWRPTEAMLERARAALPELPAARAERLERELELPAETARLLAFRAELGDFFESAVQAANGEARTLANWTTNELAARIGDADPAATEARAGRVRASWWRWWARRRSPRAPAREVLDVLLAEGGDPAAVVERAGARPRRERRAGARSSTARSPRTRTRSRRSGPASAKAIGAIVGAVMRETKGRADGGEVQRMITRADRRLSAPRRILALMACALIRMDRTGHTTLAEWTADDDAAFDAAAREFARAAGAGLHRHRAGRARQGDPCARAAARRGHW